MKKTGIVVYSLGLVVCFYFLFDAWVYGREGAGFIAYLIVMPFTFFFFIRLLMHAKSCGNVRDNSVLDQRSLGTEKRAGNFPQYSGKSDTKGNENGPGPILTK
jgi:hypothetical protein